MIVAEVFFPVESSRVAEYSTLEKPASPSLKFRVAVTVPEVLTSLAEKVTSADA